MTISELKNKILAKGWQFKFISPNPLKKNDFGWKNLEQAEKEYGGFDSYLRKISESQGLKQLNIDTKAKNGSGFKKTGIFLVEIEPIANIGNIEKIEPVKIEEPIKSISAINNFENAVSHEVTKTPITVNTPIISSNPQKMDDIRTVIENATMKTELQFLNAEANRLRETNKKLDQKNEDLYNEVSRLTRELGTISAKTDLDFQKKEIELLSQQKSGLGGIVEEVKSMDPKTLGMIISVFQPNNQAVKAMMGGDNNDNGQAASSLSGAKHEDSDTQSFIEDNIYPMLTAMSTGAVGMVGGLIEYFAKYPDHLALTYKKWLPIGEPVTKASTTVTSTDDDDLDDDN